MLSIRLRMQKRVFKDNLLIIKHCDFYNIIIQINSLFKKLEDYCAKQYGILIIPTPEDGIADSDYNENNLFTISDEEAFEKLSFVNVLEFSGYTQNSITNILKLTQQMYARIMTEYELNTIASSLTHIFYKRLDYVLYAYFTKHTF